MAQRRFMGRFAPATSESARRQLMQPVSVWEKVWVASDAAGAGTSLKVMKWVRTDKKPQFSDDEGETDAPLAPLPDEPELADDEDAPTEDVDDSRAASERPPAPMDGEDRPETEPTAHKPHPLSMSFLPEDMEDVSMGLAMGDDPTATGTLDATLDAALDAELDAELELGVVADQHLRQDAPMFERATTMSRIDVGEEVTMEGGVLVEDVVEFNVEET